MISVAATAPSFVDIFCPSWPSRRTRRCWIHGSDIIIRPSQPGDVACNYSLPRRPSSPITIEAEPRKLFNPRSLAVSMFNLTDDPVTKLRLRPVIINSAENPGPSVSAI